MGAVWAGINEQSVFTVEGAGIDPVMVRLGEDAQCFRGTIAVAGRKPIRHLVAVSAEVAKTPPGADPEGKRTVLCDDDPTFIFYRIAQRFGLPVAPEWAGWFKEELRRRDTLQPLVGVGLGCSPVLVTGTKKIFLNWIGRALRQKTHPVSGIKRAGPLERGARILQLRSDGGRAAKCAGASPMIAKLLRRAYPAQILAIMGLVRRWQQARAGAVIAECGTGKTLISLGALYTHAEGRRFTALAMVPPHLVEKRARESFQTLPGVRVFLIDGLRTPTSAKGHYGVNEVKGAQRPDCARGVEGQPERAAPAQVVSSARKHWDEICTSSAVFVVGRDRAKLGYFWRHVSLIPTAAPRGVTAASAVSRQRLQRYPLLRAYSPSAQPTTTRRAAPDSERNTTPRESRIPLGEVELYSRGVGQGTAIIVLHGGSDFNTAISCPTWTASPIHSISSTTISGGVADPPIVCSPKPLVSHRTSQIWRR